MAINNILGSIGIVDTGDYNAATTYGYLNIARANNHWFLYRLQSGAVAGVAPPETFVDSTEWRAFVESGDNNLASITEATDGLITVERKGLSDFTFYDGHKVKKEGSTALDHTDNLEFKGTNVSVSNTDASTTQIDLSAMDTLISTNKTNADASKVITDNITLSSAISLDDVKVLEGFITLDEMIDLNIINDQMAAIIKALGRSDAGFTSQVFSIPSPVSSWTTANFTTRGDVNISSTGVITQPSSTSWVYGVAGELYIKPPLGYHKQTATVNGNSFLFVTIGMSFSKIYHAGYIDDLVEIKDYDGTDDTVPNPDNIFLKNYAGHQFTASKDHSDESTDGITVFEYTASDARQRLFTMTLPILASVDDNYDSQDKFEIQTDKGLNAFFFHSGSDSVITAGLKAGIAANAASIKVLEAHIDRYPDETDINGATVGQILSKQVENVAGEVSFMSFDTEPQGTPGVDALLLVVNYPPHSPLTTFTGINVPINTTGLDADGIASALVTSFNTDTNDADLVAFRTGYVGTDGITYGGYTATSSGATFTITSDNVGSVYNAEVNVYTMAASFRELNLKPFEHGEGGPRAINDYIDPPSAITVIADFTEYTTARGTGWAKGDQLLTTGEVVVPLGTVAATAWTVTATYTGNANNSRFRLQDAIGDVELFKIISDATPTNQNPTQVSMGGFGGTIAGTTGEMGVFSNNSGGTGVHFLEAVFDETGTLAEAVTSIETCLNTITTDSAGTVVTNVRNGGSGNLTAGGTYQRLFTTGVVDETLTLTGTVAGLTAMTSTDVNNVTVDTLTNGTDAVVSETTIPTGTMLIATTATTFFDPVTMTSYTVL